LTPPLKIASILFSKLSITFSHVQMNPKFVLSDVPMLHSKRKWDGAPEGLIFYILCDSFPSIQRLEEEGELEGVMQKHWK